MQTDDLIAQLSARLEPVKSSTVTRLLLGAIAVGVSGSILVVLTVIGLRHDLNSAMVSFGMWTKLAYTFAIAGFGFWLVERAGRPGAEMTRPAVALALPLLAILLLAALRKPAGARSSRRRRRREMARVMGSILPDAEGDGKWH